MHILAVTMESLPGFEHRNLPLVRELISRGHDAVHTGPTHAMLGSGLTTTTFDPSFADEDEAKAANTQLFSSWAELVNLIDRTQVVLFGTGKGYDAISHYAAREGKIVLWHRDVGSDHVWIHDADLVAVRGRTDVALTMELTRLPRERIVVTGCTMFDRAAPKHARVSRSNFCQKYGLDSQKKIAVFHSYPPAAHSPEYKAQYSALIRSMSNVEGWGLMIKPHPREFARIKQELTYDDPNTPTWRQLAPGVPACEAPDSFECFRHADVFLSMNSAIYREAALCHKPLLEVDIPELRVYCGLGGLAELAPYVPTVRFETPRRRPWTFAGALDSVRPTLPFHLRPMLDTIDKEFRDCYGTARPEYIGSECSLKELPIVLKENLVQGPDASVFKSFIEEYCHANDGNAYYRVADFVDSVSTRPEFQWKLAGLRGLPKIASLARRAIRPWLQRNNSQGHRMAWRHRRWASH